MGKIPVIAIVGRPNVGKSTLFNRLTRSQQALVVDEPGVTRDRQFGQFTWENHPFIVIDTGGFTETPEDEIESQIIKQAMQALQDADLVYFVVDARQGLTHVDIYIAKQLRKKAKSIFLIVNKMDGLDEKSAGNEFYQLGFSQTYFIASSHNQGIATLLDQTLAYIPIENESHPDSEEIASSETKSPKIAIVGRPNVGKSTLVNRMLGEERVIVCDRPGTTRGAIFIEMERMGNHYTLIDTAGVRKKKSVTEKVEKFSVIKTLQAIEEANVVLLVFDAKLGLTDQDLNLIQFTIEAGRGLIVCANKWDGMENDAKEEVKKQLTYRLRFADFAKIYFISALHGTNVGNLFAAIDRVYYSAMLALPTADLSLILESAVEAHPPPLVRGRRIKLRYAHCGGHNPPTIVIHGNQTEEVPLSYQKYLSHYFIKTLKLEGTPLKIVFKSSENPFAGKRNTLTKRQAYKRKRLMAHVKKHKKKKR